jgi:hypothetical protein
MGRIIPIEDHGITRLLSPGDFLFSGIMVFLSSTALKGGEVEKFSVSWFCSVLTVSL